MKITAIFLAVILIFQPTLVSAASLNQDFQVNQRLTSYDANGNTTSTIDQEGHETQAYYDLANNNLLWSKDALGRQTTYSYDATGTPIFYHSLANWKSFERKLSVIQAVALFRERT